MLQGTPFLAVASAIPPPLKHGSSRECAPWASFLLSIIRHVGVVAVAG